MVVRDNESDDEAGDEAPDDDSSAEDFGSFSIYVCLLKVLGESEQRSKLVTQNVGEYRGEVWFATSVLTLKTAWIAQMDGNTLLCNKRWG